MSPVLPPDIFFKFIDQISDPVFMFDGDLCFIKANKAFTTLTGIPEKIIKSMGLGNILSADDFKSLKEKLMNISPENPAFSNIFPVILKDGSILVEKWHNEGVFDESGKLLFYYCIYNLLEQNKEIRQSKITPDFLANTFIKPAFPGVIILVEHKTYYISNRVYEILGIVPDEIPANCGLADIFKLADPDFPEESLISVKVRPDAKHEIRFHRSSEQERWVSLNLKPETYNGRNVDLYLMEDITDRKLTEIEAEKVRKSLASVMRYAKIGYWEKDFENDCWIWSDEIYEIYGIEKDTLITEDLILTFLDEATKKDRKNRLAKILKSGHIQSPFRFEHSIILKNKQQKWLAGEAYYENGRYYGWTQDISGHKLIEEELRNARDKAEESERLKSAFLANMSHEIRTPLNAILGFSDLLTSDPSEEEKIKFKKIINQSSSMLLKIIDDILDISSIEAGAMELAPEIIDVQTILEDVSILYSDFESDGIEFIVEKPEKPISLKADRGRLKQVFINLINNAFKYTKHGTITVKCKKVNKSVLFSVSDTGEGIPEDTIEYIFDQFYQVDNFSKGTGLGLAISRSIIEKMGGKINAKSTPGKGSVFSFTLPAD